MHAATCNCPRCRGARDGEFEAESFSYEFGGFRDSESEFPLSEAEEVELAMELLSVSSEAEMDQFLGKMFKKVWRGVKKVGSVVGKIARPLGGVLKAVAKKALPFVGGALGTLIPIPGVGTALGSALGGALSKALELETAGMNDEDREFEMARRFVRIAASAAQQAALAPPDMASEVSVRDALVAAIRNDAPRAELGELEYGGASAAMSGTSGRWIRRGRNIIVQGA